MLRPKQKKSKKGFDGEFDITPMIDVVMLLLIFFMVAARMAPRNITQLPKSKNGEMASQHDGVVLCVKAGAGDVPIVSTLEGTTFSSDREEQSAEIAEYVQRAFEDETKKYVLIQGEPMVLSADISRIRIAVSTVMEPEQEIMIAVEH